MTKNTNTHNHPMFLHTHSNTTNEHGHYYNHNKKVHAMRCIGRFLTVSLALICVIGILMIPEAYATGDGRVMLTVKQLINGTDLPAINDQIFIYRLTPKTSGAPMPENSNSEGYTFSITGITDVQVGPLVFNFAESYLYELKCVTNRNADITYDQQIYTIEVYFTNDMSATVAVFNDEGDKVTDIVFRHGYDKRPSDPDNMPNTPVVKTVAGNPSTNSTFIFKLVASNPSNPMPEGSIDGVKTVQVTGSGQITFGTWSYAAEGTYYYTVSEVNSGASNYTYDDAVYTITDSVSEEDGRLVVTRVVTNSSNKQVMSFTFINTYRSGGGTTKPPSTPKPTPTPTPAPSNPPGNPAKPVEPSPGAPPAKPDNPERIGDDDPPLGGLTPNAGNGPKTGDESQVVLNIAMLCAAGIAALGSVLYLLIGKRSGMTTD